LASLASELVTELEPVAELEPVYVDFF